MKIVIETDAFTNQLQAGPYLKHMQTESDEAAKAWPEDFTEGYGSMSLGTAHMGINARIVGFLREVDAPNPGMRYAIDPIN